MHWGEEELWQKAKAMHANAGASNREEPLFAFWHALCLELLARAALAHCHPSLLADVGPSSDGNNLLYACGITPKVKNFTPVSVKTKTVFSRCEKIIEAFTVEEEKFCNDFMNKRNEEIHTGGPGFAGYETGEWLADYYRVCKILLKHQGKTLEMLFGADETKAAEEMIAAAQETNKKETLDAISAAKKNYAALSPEEQSSRGASAKKDRRIYFRKKVLPLNCPACGNECPVLCEPIRAGETRLQDGEIVQEMVVLPVKLDCSVCGLELKGHAQLHAAGLGGQRSMNEVQDPVKYHDIDIGEYIADYYEPEYDNE